MGLSPQQIDAMSVWQYFALVDGWVKANDTGGGGKLSESEKDEIWEWMQGKEKGTAPTLQ
jgi:hypothetical protein